MPIQFEQVTGEISADRAPGADAHAATPASEDDLREKLQDELALLRERRARLFAD